jgi:uncharacterized membrane protein
MKQPRNAVRTPAAKALALIACSVTWSAALLGFGACSSGSGDPGKVGSHDTPIVCEVTPPTSCTDPAIHYTDVEPILQQRCVVCHDGKPMGPWPLTSYEHVADWANEIRGQVSACNMPPADAGGVMTNEERDRLLLWVRCGAKK